MPGGQSGYALSLPYYCAGRADWASGRITPLLNWVVVDNHGHVPMIVGAEKATRD